MAKHPNLYMTGESFTDELQSIISVLSEAPQKSWNEEMLLEMARRLLALKNGGKWNDTPRFPVDPI